MSIDEYDINLRSDTYNANNCKNALFEALRKDGEITKEQYEKFIKEYVVVIKRPGMFSKLWDKLAGHKEDGTYYCVAKIV